jgi:lipopolysaccharide transport system ATP-binding protein
LIVDEVLAVGDIEFQRKAIGKMRDISRKQGRTVIFVSHNMTSITSLCTHVIQMESGQVIKSGSPVEVVEAYLSTGDDNILEQRWDNPENAPGNEAVKIKKVKLNYLENSGDPNEIFTNTPFNITYQFWNLQGSQNLNISTRFVDSSGNIVFTCWTKSVVCDVGLCEGTLNIPGGFLNDGNYTVDFTVVRDTSIGLFVLQPALSFTVHDFRGNMKWYGKIPGAVRPTIFDFPFGQRLNN